MCSDYHHGNHLQRFALVCKEIWWNHIFRLDVKKVVFWLAERTWDTLETHWAPPAAPVPDHSEEDKEKSLKLDTPRCFNNGCNQENSDQWISNGCHHFVTGYKNMTRMLLGGDAHRGIYRALKGESWDSWRCLNTTAKSTHTHLPFQ